MRLIALFVVLCFSTVANAQLKSILEQTPTLAPPRESVEPKVEAKSEAPSEAKVEEPKSLSVVVPPPVAENGTTKLDGDVVATVPAELRSAIVVSQPVYIYRLTPWEAARAEAAAAQRARQEYRARQHYFRVFTR